MHTDQAIVRRQLVICTCRKILLPSLVTVSQFSGTTAKMSRSLCALVLTGLAVFSHVDACMSSSSVVLYQQVRPSLLRH